MGSGVLDNEPCWLVISSCNGACAVEVVESQLVRAYRNLLLPLVHLQPMNLNSREGVSIHPSDACVVLLHVV